MSKDGEGTLAKPGTFTVTTLQVRNGQAGPRPNTQRRDRADGELAQHSARWAKTASFLRDRGPGEHVHSGCSHSAPAGSRSRYDKTRKRSKRHRDWQWETKPSLSAASTTVHPPGAREKAGGGNVLSCGPVVSPHAGDSRLEMDISKNTIYDRYPLPMKHPGMNPARRVRQK